MGLRVFRFVGDPSAGSSSRSLGRSGGSRSHCRCQQGRDAIGHHRTGSRDQQVTGSRRRHPASRSRWSLGSDPEALCNSVKHVLPKPFSKLLILRETCAPLGSANEISNLALGQPQCPMDVQYAGSAAWMVPAHPLRFKPPSASEARARSHEQMTVTRSAWQFALHDDEAGPACSPSRPNRKGWYPPRPKPVRKGEQ